ncbi:MAG TPA: TlpA disulfide reductase family protein [Chitinophagaceae bacterium]|nr:TlpA disulfide reductase family protein [Chitinophagaceae bacterium]
MKKYYLVFILLFLTMASYSQDSRIKMNEKSIVKDSSGFVYPASIWGPLMFKGDVIIKPVDPKNRKTEFLLTKLNEAQKNEFLSKMPKPEESLYFRTGKKLALFKTTDINDRKINLKDEKGKIIVLNFWFIDCPPCRMEIPDLNQLVEEYKGNDSVLFIGVALDPKPDIKDFLETMPFNYTLIHDGKSIATEYGIRAFPTHVIIDKEGKIYFHTSGLAVNTVFWLKKSINELLSSGVVKN